MSRENTVRVRMTTDRSWEQDGRTVSCGPGEEVDVPADEAKRLLSSHQAEPVAVKPSSRAEKRTAPKSRPAPAVPGQ